MYGNDMRQLCTEKTQSWRGAHEVRLEISGRDRFSPALATMLFLLLSAIPEPPEPIPDSEQKTQLPSAIENVGADCWATKCDCERTASPQRDTTLTSWITVQMTSSNCCAGRI